MAQQRTSADVAIRLVARELGWHSFLPVPLQDPLAELGGVSFVFCQCDDPHRYTACRFAFPILYPQFHEGHLPGD